MPRFESVRVTRGTALIALLTLFAGSLVACSSGPHPQPPPDGEQRFLLQTDDKLFPNQIRGFTGPVSSASVQQLQDQLAQQTQTLSTYRLSPGDSFKVDVLEHPEWSTQVEVGLDGNILFGYLEEPLPAEGKTIEEVRADLIVALDEFFIGPQVKVHELTLARNSSTVSVIGAVNEPGRVKIVAGSRILDAIADVGGPISQPQGLNGSYDENQVRLPLIDWAGAVLLREAQYLPTGTVPAEVSRMQPGGAPLTDLCRVDVDFAALIGGDSQHNIPLFPGDVLSIPEFIPENNRVFVGGEVGTPGVYYYREHMSLFEVLARAGWVDRETGHNGGVYLVRNSRAAQGEQQVAILNVNNIGTGKARDIMLRDGDLVYVDTNYLTEINRFSLGLLPFFQLLREIPGAYISYRDFDFVR